MSCLNKIFRNAFTSFENIYKCTSASRFKSSKPQKTKFQKNYIIVRVKPKDFPDILKLFWTSFARDEPCFVAAGLNFKYNPIFEDRVMAALCQGLSLMAKCRSDGEIVGAAINSTICPWDADIKDRIADNCLCRDTADLIHFLAHVTREPNLFCKYCQLKIYEMAYLMVRKRERGKGIATALVRAAHNDCRDMGYDVCRIDCTNEATAVICKKLGYKLEWEMPYSAYITADGNQLYYPPPPNKIVRVYVDFPRYENCKET